MNRETALVLWGLFTIFLMWGLWTIDLTVSGLIWTGGQIERLRFQSALLNLDPIFVYHLGLVAILFVWMTVPFLIICSEEKKICGEEKKRREGNGRGF